jgi:hypothetical protein
MLAHSQREYDEIRAKYGDDPNLRLLCIKVASPDSSVMMHTGESDRPFVHDVEPW